MSPSDASRRDVLRSARECALAVCACWLVVQNVILVTALLSGGLARAWGPLLPVLGIALAIMMPLWLVPAAALLVAGLHRGPRACAPHEAARASRTAA